MHSDSDLPSKKYSLSTPSPRKEGIEVMVQYIIQSGTLHTRDQISKRKLIPDLQWQENPRRAYWTTWRSRNKICHLPRSVWGQKSLDRPHPFRTSIDLEEQFIKSLYLARIRKNIYCSYSVWFNFHSLHNLKKLKFLSKTPNQFTKYSTAFLLILECVI